MNKNCYQGTLLTCLLFLPSTALAQDVKEQPEAFQNVINCRLVEDDSARLSCYDDSVTAMDQAAQSENLVVMSRESVKKARRGLFGLTLPNINLFGGGDKDEDEVKRIDAKITSYSRGQSGWVVTLEDGAVWQQADTIYVGRPTVGDEIVIERAALGSFKAKIDGGISFRVKRLN